MIRTSDVIDGGSTSPDPDGAVVPVATMNRLVAAGQAHRLLSGFLTAPVFHAGSWWILVDDRGSGFVVAPKPVQYELTAAYWLLARTDEVAAEVGAERRRELAAAQA